MANRNNDNPASRNESGNGGPNGGGGETVAEKVGSASGDAGAGAGAPAGAGTGTKAGKPAAKVDHETVNPASIAPDNYVRDATGAIVYKADGVTPKRRPGRKAGGSITAPAAPKSKPARSDAERGAVAVEMLAAQFQILNLGIATLTSFEDFKLDDGEAKEMAKATANVMAQFDYVPDPKVAAVLGLVTTTSMIYGPRVYLFRKDRAAKRVAKRAANIVEADENASTGGTTGGAYPGAPTNMGQFSG